MSRVLIPTIVAIVTAAAVTAGQSAVSPDAGRRFYLEGAGENGRPVGAVVQGDLRVTSAVMPCVNCHRRSGWGTTEGTLTTPPVVGPVLFAATTVGNTAVGIRTSGQGTRPAYDETSFLRALRDGVDPGGRRLSSTMPRYQVDERPARSLLSYLRTLGSTPAPGVSEDTLHLATITSPGADPARQASMLAVLREFVRAKNAESRNETRRREQGPWDMKAHYQLYRRWELHEWALTGDARDWKRQLTEQYSRAPVFAVLAGTAGGTWAPVHQFCEEQGIPCVFPLADAPPVAEGGRGFYSLYFSPGVSVEASALATFLRDRPVSSSRRVLQVVECHSAGAEGARVLADSLGASASSVACVNTPAELTEVLKRPAALEADVVVAWVRKAYLDALAAAVARWRPAVPLYLSSSLLGDRVAIPEPLGARAWLLESQIPIDGFERHALRGLAWIRARHLQADDRRAAVDTLFAASLMAEAVATPRVLESREYLVEQFEHMVGRTPLVSAYPSLSLGAGRRFASLGCAILPLGAQPQSSGVVAPWFIPELRATDVSR